MKSILQRVLTEARHVPEAIRLVWAATARWTAIWLLLLLVQGLLPAAAVYLTRDVVDGFLGVVGSGGSWRSAAPVAWPAALLGSVMVLQALAGGASAWVRALQTDVLQDHISGLIHRKSIAVGMAFYDFPEFHDHLHRARDEAQYRPAALLDVTGGLLQSALTLAAVAAVLMPFGPWLPVGLLVGGLPTLGFVLRNTLRRREWSRRTTPEVRKTWYYDYLLTTRQSAAEIRVFGLGGALAAAYQSLRERLRREQLGLVRGEVLGEILAALLGLAVGALAAAWVLWQAIQGRMSAGTVAMFFAAFVQAQGLLRSLLHNAGQVYANSLFLGNLFEFLGWQPQSDDGPAVLDGPAPEVRTGIRFDAVHFTYPGADRPALTHFSLDVPAGRTVAVVGPNGAGKSTLIKLLCRFYEPDRGRISIDGIDIRQQSPAAVRRFVSVLFQEPVRYAASVQGNVAPGFGPAPAESLLGRALRSAGAESIVAHLPLGTDTLLGKEFDDGVELSGGEWQRIALARALFRASPILLLDEPTSAMDSWAEADWFERFRSASGGRTTIIITHRFTTAMQADVIHVMDDGRVVESGSHEQLLARGGRYAASWSRQTRERELASA